MSRVLVIDDDAAVTFALERSLASLGHEVRAAPNAERGLELAGSERFDLVLLDLKLPRMSGQDALGELRKLRPDLSVVVLTAHGSAETAMDTLAAGAFDHLTKPIGLDDLRRVVDRALGSRSPTPPTAARTELKAGTLIGRSRPMQEVGKRVGILARSDASVLVLGESGTGKEYVARAIHERSARRDAPFIPVSCAAIPEALMEAELFGAVRGAFTGATRDRAGKIESAQGGTLFLDEVGEISLAAQVKLLRFLEDHVVERLGEETRRPIDVRVVAATNADLEKTVREGRFREDLFYRLNVVTIMLPPLRERREDIALLVEHFLARSAVPMSIAPEATERLVAAPWPGNVRELRNAVEHAVAISRGGTIQVEHLPTSIRDAAPGVPDAGGLEAIAAIVSRVVELAGGQPGLCERLVGAAEKAAIVKALELSGGSQVVAARLLDLPRSTFRKRMDDHGLK